MFNFIIGLVIGLIVGGTIGLVFASLFAAAKKDEQQVERIIKTYNNKSGQ